MKWLFGELPLLPDWFIGLLSIVGLVSVLLAFALLILLCLDGAEKKRREKFIKDQEDKKP